MAAPILIIAIGNESRGDDALAPLLLRQIDRWLVNKARAEQFELIEEFQLQIEHAMDMVGRELILFIDAGMDTPAPFSFYRIEPNHVRTLFSHALTPEAVIATYGQLYQQCSPPAFVLCVKGEKFDLGSPLSSQAQQNMVLVMGFMEELLHKPRPLAWEERCTQH